MNSDIVIKMLAKRKKKEAGQNMWGTNEIEDSNTKSFKCEWKTKRKLKMPSLYEDDIGRTNHFEIFVT
jgi:hypothetical protein